MRGIVVSIVVLYSAVSFSSSQCRYFYGPAKRELKLISFALDSHVQRKEITDDLARRSINRFLKIMEPLNFIFLKSEIKNFQELPKPKLEEFKKELTESETREFHEFVQRVAGSRISILASKLLSKKSVRDEIEKRMEHYEKDYDQMLKPAERPDTLAQLESNFIDYMARRASYYKNEGNGALTTRQALVMAIRYFRQELMNNSYLYNNSMLPSLIVKSFVDSLDAHSGLVMGREYQEYAQMFGAEQVGIGAVLSGNFKGYEIIKVNPDSGADRAKLQAGDIITHIKVTEERNALFAPHLQSQKKEWLPIRSLDMTNVIRHLVSGEPQTTLDLKILRDGKTLDFRVERYTIKRSESLLHSHMYSTSDGNVAYVKLDSFYENAGDHVIKMIRDLKFQKAKGLILDLRWNGGGSVPEFQKILGIFVKKGPALVAQDAEGRTHALPIKEDMTYLSSLWDGPLIVLVNKGSASASEALSGALKDYGRAVIIGEDTSTYGKGSMQDIVPISQSMILKVTGHLFSSPNGGHRQFDGVAPDIIIENPNKYNFARERDLDNVIPPPSLEPTFLLENRNSFIKDKPRLVEFMETALRDYKESAADTSLPATSKSETGKGQSVDKVLDKTVFLMSRWISGRNVPK